MGSAKEKLMTRDLANVLLAYDPDSGVFVWRVNRGNSYGRVGAIAGGLNAYGYVCIEIGGAAYLAHRLAWLMAHGEWPSGYVDHINNVRSDNRLENLRVVDFTTNIQNQRLPSKNNTTGFLGVHKRKVAYAGKPFSAQIRDPVAKRIIHLGYFETAEEAYAAYVAKKRLIHPGCTI